MIHVMLKVN